MSTEVACRAIVLRLRDEGLETSLIVVCMQKVLLGRAALAYPLAMTNILT
jgi:hypothetical protein